MPEILHRLDGPDGRVVVVVVPPALNHQNADAMRDCVERWLPNRDDAAAILDLSAVVLISTIGIAALLQVEDLCRRRGAAFALAGVPPRQKDLLRMLHLTDKFRTVESVEEALAVI